MKARKKEKAANSRGIPSSKAWLGFGGQDGKRGSRNDEWIPGVEMD